MAYGMLQLAQSTSRAPSGPTARIGLSRLLSLYGLDPVAGKDGALSPSRVIKVDF